MCKKKDVVLLLNRQFDLKKQKHGLKEPLHKVKMISVFLIFLLGIRGSLTKKIFYNYF